MATDTATAAKVETFNDVTNGLVEAYNFLLDATGEEPIDRGNVEQALAELDAVLKFFDPTFDG